jgi:hypothetical protein
MLVIARGYTTAPGKSRAGVTQMRHCLRHPNLETSRATFQGATVRPRRRYGRE